MLDELKLRSRDDRRFHCTYCGESMDAEGFDPFELLRTTHYCRNVTAPATVDF